MPASQIDLNPGKSGPFALKKTVLKAGAGPTPKSGDKVWAHYRGACAATPQEPFDCSCPKPHRKNGFDFVVGAGAVIQGWDLGVASMQVGEVAELFIGSELGYGEAGTGAGGPIPGGADLVFEIELLHVGPTPDETVDGRSELKKKYGKA